MFYYGQDTWRITPKLTLNYGLRWEVYFPEYVNGKDNGGFANLVQGLDRVAGEGGIRLNGNINNAWDAFAPRLGVAYQLNPKTVVRMGYGRSFDMGVFGSNFGHTVTQTLPVLAAQLAQGASQEVPCVYPGPGTSNLQFPGNSREWIVPGIRTKLLSESSFQCGRDKTPSFVCSPISVQPPNACQLWTLGTLQCSARLLTRPPSKSAYIGNKGTHVFAGDGPTYNVNNPSMVGYCANAACTAKTPQLYRRPYYNNFTYTGYSDPTNIQADLPAPGRPGLSRASCSAARPTRTITWAMMPAANTTRCRLSLKSASRMACRFCPITPSPTPINTTIRTILTILP